MARGNVDAMSGVGTGPYISENFEPGVRASFRRNPNYFRTDDPGYLDSFELIRVPDASARANALQNGELDVFESVDKKTASRLAARPGLALYNVEGNQHYSFPMRCECGIPLVTMMCASPLKRRSIVKLFWTRFSKGLGISGMIIPLARAIISIWLRICRSAPMTQSGRVLS